MSVEERLLRLENAFATLAELQADQHRRVKGLEESFVLLTTLVRSQNEGMDEVRAAAADADARIAALADAHIRTEDALARLTERMDGLAERVDRLGEHVNQLTERVDRIAAVVERHVGDGHGG